MTDSQGDAGSSSFAVATSLLARWRIVVLWPTIAAILTVVVVLLFPLRYTTLVSFVPASPDIPLGNLAGLAQKFGLSLPGELQGVPPDFYADLLSSAEVMRDIATQRFAFVDGGDTLNGTLSELYSIHEATPDRTLFETIRFLQDEVVDVSVNRQTSLVTATVQTRWPALSRIIAARLLRTVDQFNVTTHRDKAAAELLFMSERLDTARTELRAAEDSLEGFLLRNREYKNDPKLVVQAERLQRLVSMRQDVFTTVTQAVESSRIESARNTPSITVVSPPRDALRFDRRHVLLKGLAALFGAMLFAILGLAGRLQLRSLLRADPAGSERLLLEVDRTLSGTPRIVRLIRSFLSE